jgi:hypothetical protein
MFLHNKNKNQMSNDAQTFLNHSNTYKTNLETYKSQFEAMLGDFKKAFILYQTSPNYGDYSTNYAYYTGNLQTINSNLFTTKNNIQRDLNDLATSTNDLDKKIATEKKIYAELIQKEENIEGSVNGSYEMISNSKEIYKSQYLSNWTMGISILVLSGLVATSFRKK